MKLVAMSCGRIRGHKRIFIADADKNEIAESPMPVFFIAHPEGGVLFDTGPNPLAFENPESAWGGLSKVFQALGGPESGVVSQLKTIGITPEDIRFVVNSHLHFDHAGGNRFSPGPLLSLPPRNGNGPVGRNWKEKAITGSTGITLSKSG